MHSEWARMAHPWFHLGELPRGEFSAAISSKVPEKQILCPSTRVNWFYNYSINILKSTTLKIPLQDSGEQGSHIHSVFTGLLSFIIYKSTQSSEKFWFPHPLRLWAAAEPRGSSPFKRINIFPNLSFLLRVCSHHHVMIFVPSLRHPHTHCVLAETL